MNREDLEKLVNATKALSSDIDRTAFVLHDFRRKFLTNQNELWKVAQSGLHTSRKMLLYFARRNSEFEEVDDKYDKIKNSFFKIIKVEKNDVGVLKNDDRALLFCPINKNDLLYDSDNTFSEVISVLSPQVEFNSSEKNQICYESQTTDPAILFCDCITNSRNIDYEKLCQSISIDLLYKYRQKENLFIPLIDTILIPSNEELEKLISQIIYLLMDGFYDRSPLPKFRYKKIIILTKNDEEFRITENKIKSIEREVFFFEKWNFQEYPSQELTKIEMNDVFCELTARQENFIKEVNSDDKDYNLQLRKLSFALDKDFNILLLGETGVGKSTIAKLIHKYSGRPIDKFSTVNLQGLPTTLIESELFGYVKGAFTGATKDTAGKIKSCDGGTLLLDEIGELPADIQAKILLFLDSKTYSPVGSSKIESADVRLIFATNKEPTQLIRSGKMREDFYYRISPMLFMITPLRERKDDLRAKIVREFQLQCKNFNIDNPRIDNETLVVLLEYSWPGNYREIENVMTQYVLNMKSENLTWLNKQVITKTNLLKQIYRTRTMLGELEELISNSISDWINIFDDVIQDDEIMKINGEKTGRNYLELFIKPIVANVVENKLVLRGFKKTQINKLIGMDITHNTKSTILKKNQIYHRIKQYFH